MRMREKKKSKRNKQDVEVRNREREAKTGGMNHAIKWKIYSQLLIIWRDVYRSEYF